MTPVVASVPAGGPRLSEHGTIRMSASDSVASAVEALASGEIIVVVDSHDRENEGDLVMAAEYATPAAINFMATHGRGLICVPMLASRLGELGIPPMTSDSSDPFGTAFHVSVDHACDTTTGISASDRAATIRALADGQATSADFTKPGHVFPLAYRPGGVLRRAGHTEASIDLAMIAGTSPTAVICEIAAADGEMAHGEALASFASKHGLAMTSIDDLIAYRRRHDKLAIRTAEARLPLPQGDFTTVGYRDVVDGHEHMALVLGDVRNRPGTLVRVHSECVTGDVFGSRRCDCGAQLELAIELIAREGSGAVIYLRGHEGRGIGLLNKIHAYQLQDEGLDTVDANLRIGQPPDRRDYCVGMQILRDLEICEPRLLTNNPAKRVGLEDYGVKILDRVPLVTSPTSDNRRYLATKQERLGHHSLL